MYGRISVLFAFPFAAFPFGAGGAVLPLAAGAVLAAGFPLAGATFVVAAVLAFGAAFAVAVAAVFGFAVVVLAVGIVKSGLVLARSGSKSGFRSGERSLHSLYLAKDSFKYHFFPVVCGFVFTGGFEETTHLSSFES